SVVLCPFEHTQRRRSQTLCSWHFLESTLSDRKWLHVAMGERTGSRSTELANGLPTPSGHYALIAGRTQPALPYAVSVGTCRSRVAYSGGSLRRSHAHPRSG